MNNFADIDALIERSSTTADDLLAAGETILEHWLQAKDETPTEDSREGFRLLALHRQGAKLDPSFNACRETCRELAWHYNLVNESKSEDAERTLTMMRFVARHLWLFVGGKLEQSGLGDFCCSSKPLRQPGIPTEARASDNNARSIG